MERNKFVYVVIALLATLTLSNCDTYNGRKKLVAELSSLYNENQIEFEIIEKYFLTDSLSKRFDFRYQDEKIEVNVGDSSVIIDHIDHIKDNRTAYQILNFMQENGIRIISGNGKEGWITLAFEDNKFPCFNFWYRSDFNPDDENVKEQIENIKDTKTKRWIYILDKKGWYVRGVKCF